MEPIFFAAPAEFRAWLEANHATADEVFVGFHRKGTGKPSMVWEEAVREALCFGWIDGITRRVDDERYQIRFTPRRPGSNWSAVNIRHVEELVAEGRMTPAGLAAYEARTPARSGYSYEQRRLARLDEAQEAQFRADAQAWAFFQAQPPGYRQTAIFWVVSAKREDTRARRLVQLIEDSAQGRRIAQLAPPPKRS